jgi:hypothetical protein
VSTEEPARPAPAGHHAPETETLLRRLSDMIAAARPIPMSASAMINREEVLELLEEAISHLPGELRDARWLLKQRDDFRLQTKRDADDILDQARARAERMVQRTEVVKAADLRARRILEEAEAESRRLRLECEDYCDQKLASFEIVLERLQKTVAAGRTKLQGNPLTGETPVVAVADDNGALFDQDRE